MLPFDAVWAVERYLIAHGWYRSPERGHGYWFKQDYFGSLEAIPLEEAYDYEASRDQVN